MARDKSSDEPILPGVNPAVEDHATPADSPPFPIVVAGASAGGLEAFNELLKALPVDTGMAFVLIQHLAPDHESLLPDILGRATAMPVTQVANNTDVKPNHVYVIPPGKSMVISHGLLQLAPRTEQRGQARPIDHFMRSLAEEHGHKAIGIVLSGTANDGTLGLEEIKAGGGITFAQDNTAEHTGMPRSAIASGAVDFVLPPDEIARELGRIARHPYIGQVDADDPSIANAPAMGRILDSLRRGTGVDFGNYKRNTLYRRITRRMVLQKLETLAAYYEFMKENAREIDALYQDVLIGVTSFFRNPEAYEALKTSVFPKLTEGRNRHEQVRVWALGCSTGEEAYSLAMTFMEYAESSGRRVGMQIFATDLNAAGIEHARTGMYPKGITQDVSPERLRRFFVEVDGRYRICKPIRDMCIFARQNALADPPFSRLDLVACRNMLIYLDPKLQRHLIPLLHYSLRGEGFLWLGGSETIGSYRDLFDLVDTKNKIYAKKAGAPNHVVLPATGKRWDGVARESAETRALAEAASAPDPQREADRILLNRYAPPGVVVNDQFDIVQFRGDTSGFLAPAPGKASLNILKMLREGLMVAVRGALQRAKRDGLPVREEGLHAKSNGQSREVDVVVIPLRGAGSAVGSMLVLFEEPAVSVEGRMRQMDEMTRSTAEQAAREPDPNRESKEVARLKQELSATRDYLQSVIEQQEAANEELQSANEEVQSANEELQSINEEVETSKEEIQSANEELSTVNDELQNRNRELSTSNNDLTNLLSSVQIAIVMLGPDLRIRRFTPPAEKLLNLIPADLGRPIGDMKLKVDVPDLEALVLEVIETISTREREVQDVQGRWYSLRIRPYRTLENKIDGAVILFVDIDRVKKAEQSVRESEARFELLANNAPVLIWVNDLAGPRFVNRAYEEFVGATESEIRHAEPGRYIHLDDAGGYLVQYEEALRAAKPFEARARLRRADGEYRWMKSVALPRIVDGTVVGFVGCTFDITDMKEAESALIELDRGKNEFLAMLAHELRNPLSGVHNAARMLAHTQDASVIGQARGIIDRQTSHMVRMVNDLLDISRITHGKIQLDLEPVDLAAVVRGSVDSTAPEREAHRQSITVDVPVEPVWIRGDAMRLDQVISNLLNNASKFTRGDGHIWVSLQRELGSRPRREAWATLRVRDDGMGIDPALLPRIFDLFVQADRFPERARTGIGLGLTLARRLVELHAGTIEARSDGQAAGSEFVVRIPLLPKGEIPERTGGRPARRAAPSPRRILIVDDNRDAAESLGLVFTLAGHTVKVVHEGGAAFPAASEFRPDAILLDIGLPDMDGYRVARALRENGTTRDTLIVATTGYGRMEDVRKSREAGIDEHMTKPVDPDRLMDYIERGRPDPSAAD
jgi:two-component system CheB/CheR fusion protein